MREFISLDPEVEQALNGGQAVVALESSFLAQGLPAPENLETAQAMESAIRQTGAVPAMIALCDGRIEVGVTPRTLAALAEEPSTKISGRDLAYALHSKALGATTVAATMQCAASAGIRIFATGGIGGVHRLASATFDISADLRQMERSAVAVVCSGAKSILDLPKTLEYLETCGVPLLGFQCDTLPAFYVAQTQYALDATLDNAHAAAEYLGLHWRLGGQGVVITVPVEGQVALPGAEVDKWLETALSEAQENAITGKAVTPYLLKRLSQLSAGRTLAANTSLLISNARVAGEISVALSANGRVRCD